MSLIVKDVLKIINSVINEKVVRNVAVVVFLITIFVGITFSFLAAFIILASYLLGYTVSWFLIKQRNKTSLYLQQLSSIYRDHYAKKVISHSCSICDDLSCRRHQKSKSVTPWKFLKISSNLNDSIKHFYERILQNFIILWYEQFTEDQDFVNELRYCLRYATSSVINRFFELDIGEIITCKLVPCAVKHLDDYLYMQQISSLKHVKFNDVVVEYLGKRLHAAATNRRNELEYLRHVVSSLLVHVLPENYVKCKNYSIILREIIAGWVFLPLMDSIADPNIINYLVILGSNYRSKKHHKYGKRENSVEILQNFIQCNDGKISSFATNLYKIKNNTELLYAFMQFLKKQDHVNLLQFCLDVDDFNGKLLTPDLSKKQLEDLYLDALKLYKDYLDKDSYNFINCPSEISEEFNSLIQEYRSIEKLTKLSRQLYKAYDHTFNCLEGTWLPLFFHSSEFYAHICGSKVLPQYNKQPNSSPGRERLKRYESAGQQGAVSKFSSGLDKIKGVLKSNQPVEGSFFPLESQAIENVTVEDILLADCKPLFRDLSAWKVSIPMYQVSHSNKIINFYVHVERADSKSEDIKKNWVVIRKEQDFYTLKAKLVEFHGESEICDSPLPARKSASFIETRMAKYEEFLKRLLKKPALRGSDLLHSFLTAEEDFTLFITTNASNIQDFGNIYQSVAYKLRKEKGQHLDSFMAAFLKSTGTKNDKLEWAEIGEELDLTSNYPESLSLPKTYSNRIFNDNFEIQYKSLKDTMSGSFNPEGFTECLFYLLKYVFKAPNGVLKLYASFCSIAQYLIDMFSKMIIERKIKSALSQANLAYLIKQLEEVVFATHVPPSKEELLKRKEKAYEDLNNIFSPLVNKLFGSNLSVGSKKLLDVLQEPHYNKQLAYNLLDIILAEMYPVLNKDEFHY